MGFVTIDPDAIYDAENHLKKLMEIVEDCRYQHRRHADDTTNAVDGLRGHDFAGLHPGEIELIWHGFPFGDLAWEFRAAQEVVRDVYSQSQRLFDVLAQAHSSPLTERILELNMPILSDLGCIADSLTDLAAWLVFDNIWSIIDRPWSIFELLSNASRCLDDALEHLEDRYAILEKLRQRALMLIEELVAPLANDAIQLGADSLNKAISLTEFLAKYLKSGGSWAKTFETSPEFTRLDGLNIGVGALLGYAADQDHSVHSLESHVAGSVIQYGVDLIPGMGEVELGVTVVGVVSDGMSLGFSAWGSAQGGYWGGKLQQVSNNWAKASTDANALGSMYTDAGAMVVDMPPDVAAVSAVAPELAPVAMVYDELTGRGTAAFNKDAGKMLSHGQTLANLPVDVGKSAWNSLVVAGGDGAQALSSHLPSFLRQPVKNAGYSAVAHAMIGG